MSKKQRRRFRKRVQAGNAPFRGFREVGDALSIKQSEALTNALRQQTGFYKREVRAISDSLPYSNGSFQQYSKRMSELISNVNCLAFVLKNGYFATFRSSAVADSSVCVPLEDAFAFMQADGVDISSVAELVSKSATDWANSKRMSEAHPVYSAVAKLLSYTAFASIAKNQQPEFSAANDYKQMVGVGAK